MCIRDSDELMATGEVTWQGHGALAGDDGWVSLHPSDIAHLTLRDPTRDADGDLPEDAVRLLAHLTGGGAYFFRTLADHLHPLTDDAVTEMLWDLVWSGRVTGDTFAPLRAYLAGGRTAHKTRSTSPRRSRYAGRGATLRGAGRLGSSGMPSGSVLRSGPARTVGRWSVLPPGERDVTVTAYAQAEILLDRYGVVTRGAVAAEDIPGGFAGVYRLLSAAEEAGRVRRGYFVEGLGASQFGTTGAVDRLRAGSRPLDDTPAEPLTALVLAACDPANPFGAALPWPPRASVEDDTATSRGHQPARKAGALVVIVDGQLVLLSLIHISEPTRPY